MTRNRMVPVCVTYRTSEYVACSESEGREMGWADCFVGMTRVIACFEGNSDEICEETRIWEVMVFKSGIKHMPENNGGG